MIEKIGDYFCLTTANLSYVFHVNKVGYLQTDYFGNKLDYKNSDLTSLGLKEVCPKGDSTVVDEKADPTFCADNSLTEYSFVQKGDYKEPALIVLNKTRGYTFDFRYDSYEICKKVIKIEELPMPRVDEELVVIVKDKSLNIFVELHYYLAKNQDVIVKNVVIRNEEKDILSIQKAASLQFDLINNNYELLSLNGNWITETHKDVQKLHNGIYIIDSKTGNSSAKHNPFFLIKEEKATEDYGEVYSFNLMYSGNHQELIELTTYDHLHIQTGINPFLFNFELSKGERFVTPFALMTYSKEGTNLSSKRMSDFINACVVNENFSYRPRPVLINNWEGTYFKFDEAKLLSIARKAKSFGIELFVLDDGWFGKRNDDTSSLGDYDVNKKKLPSGLKGLAKKINKIGLKFGLWFEPEAISVNSNLYREHPEYAISTRGVEPSLGRHELLLDLSKKEVQDYIIEQVSSILKSANIEYVKWDMNRSISDIRFNNYHPGEFYHRYILGLYRVINELTKQFPHILFENCASGGNRFDLGMLHYFPQTWVSDCSDPYERLSIQGGVYFGYPQSVVTGHVSHRSNHQVLRETNYSTKFNVAAFTNLGYELSLDELTPFDQKIVKNQIAFYKEHRELLQFGQFSKLKDKEYEGDNAIWMVKSNDCSEAIVGYFNGLQSARPKETVFKDLGLKNDSTYEIQVVGAPHSLKLFGNLINMVLPLHVNCDGFIVRTISKYKGMDCEEEKYTVSGSILNNGLTLQCEWAGNGYNNKVRVLGDFGSRLYYIKEIKK